MTSEDRNRIANHMRLRLELIRGEQDRTLFRLRNEEIREHRLIDQFQHAFPDLDIEDVPPTPWEELSAHQHDLLRFIARRGRIRRIHDLLPAYHAETGDLIGEAALRTRLTRLRRHRALLRGHYGWVVAPALLMVALAPAPPPAVRCQLVRAGNDRLAHRVQCLAGPSVTPAWSPRASRPGDDKGLPPGLAAVLRSTPTDQAFTIPDLVPRQPGAFRAKIIQRTHAQVMRLVRRGMLVRVGRGRFARAHLAPAVPARSLSAALSPALAVALERLPDGPVVTLVEWTLAWCGSATLERRDQLSNLITDLVRRGVVRRVGRGQYERGEADASESEGASG